MGITITKKEYDNLYWSTKKRWDGLVEKWNTGIDCVICEFRNNPSNISGCPNCNFCKITFIWNVADGKKDDKNWGCLSAINMSGGWLENNYQSLAGSNRQRILARGIVMAAMDRLKEMIKGDK